MAASACSERGHSKRMNAHLYPRPVITRTRGNEKNCWHRPFIGRQICGNTRACRTANFPQTVCAYFEECRIPHWCGVNEFVIMNTFGVGSRCVEHTFEMANTMKKCPSRNGPTSCCDMNQKGQLDVVIFDRIRYCAVAATWTLSDPRKILHFPRYGTSAM